MKRIVGSISLLILLLNTLGTPLTYAEEYAQESVNAGVIDDIQNDDVVENDEGDEQSPQFPINENFDNEQKPEIDPVDSVEPVDPVENPTDPVVPVIDEGSGGTVEEPVNSDDNPLGSGGNQGGENGDNSDALSGGNQEVGSQTGESGTSETDFSGGNNESSGSGGSSTEDSEDEGGESGIISTVTSTLYDFLSTIRFFFVSDNNDYIKESKIKGIKAITLEDPENGEKLTIMDRNLGAEDNDIQSEDSYGYYYQWGNNNGFEEVNDSNVTSMLAVYSGKYEGIGYTRDNKFRVGSSDIWETDEEGRSNYEELWYLGENVEVQGPCPEGYHIPSLNEWNKLVSIWTKIHTQDEKEEVKVTRSTSSNTIESSLERCGTGDFENQENCLVKEELPGLANLFMDELKLPRAGRYTNGEKEDSLGVYRTRTPGDLSYQSEVFSIEKFFGVAVNENDYKNRSNANSLRCFRNTKAGSSLFSSLSFGGDDSVSLNDVESFTVTFDANRGAYEEKPADQTVSSGTTATQPTLNADFRLPGYTFTGWYTEPKDGVKWNFDTDVVTGNITLYAHWDYALEFGELDAYLIGSDGTISKYVMMDRNLGASEIYDKNYTNPSLNSVGYTYQWGNNWGFERCKNNTDCFGDGKVNPYTNQTRVDKTPGWEDYLPSKFTRKYYVTPSSSQIKGWQNGASPSDALWGNGASTIDDRQGPCPEGYYVPTWNVVNSSDGLFLKWGDSNGIVVTNNGKFGSVEQKIFTSQFLWPLAGHHNKGKIQDSDKGVCADYWTSSSDVADSAFNMWFCKDGGNNSYGNPGRFLTSNKGQRNSASSVRCFKKSNDDANLAIYPDKGTGAVITVDKLNGTNTIIALTEPTRIQAGLGKLTFDGWYTDLDDPSTRKEEKNTASPQTDSTVYTLSANETALYAKWSCPREGYEYNGISCAQRHTITFNASGGTIDVGGIPQTITTGSLLYGVTYNYSDLPIPTRPGHVFKGWYTNFDGVDDYIDYGRDLMFTDQISFHASAYMDTWDTGKRIVSSMQDGGWALDGGEDGIFRVSAYRGKPSTSVVRAQSDMKRRDLSSGWHDFDFVFDGNQLKLYLDGSLKATSTSGQFPDRKIVYNSNNTILVGAAASANPTSPEGYYFEGMIKDIIFKNSDQIITSTNALSAPNQDVTYYAYWKPIATDYTVDVDIVPSAGGNVTGTGTYNVGDSITLTATPAEGYQFSGWFDSSDNLVSNVSPYIFTADASNGTGLKALFEIKQYTVTAESNDVNKGTISFPGGPYTHGMSIQFSPEVTDSLLYKFLKWTLNGNEVLTGNNKYLTGNLVIEELTGNINVVGFFTGYNTCPFNNQIIQHGETVTGYKYATVSYGQSCDSEIRTCNDGKLSGSYQYASCEPEAPASCPLPWGGELAHGQSVTGYKASSVTCPNSCESQQATCNNGSWSVDNFVINYKSSTCTYNEYSCGEGFTLDACPAHGTCSEPCIPYSVSENACVPGIQKYKLIKCDEGYHIDNDKCTANEYAVIFDANGGAGTMAQDTATYGSDYTFKNSNFTKEGSTFSGWNTKADKSGTGYYSGQIVPWNFTSDLTLYAQWKVNTYTVTYDAQSHSGTIDGQPTLGQEVEYGTEITLPSENIESQNEYTFIGWTTEKNGKTPLESNTYTVTGNVTFYPIFKKEKVQKDIKFYVNNNSGYIYDNVTYRENKLFSGCTIPTLYNTDPYTGSCSVHITLPDIIAHENTPIVLGWSTGAEERTIKYSTGVGVTIIIPENKNVELYAQTKSDVKTYEATYEIDRRVEEVTETSDTCSVPVTYNGNPQQTVCTGAITLPNIAARPGYNTPIWKLGETEYDAGAQVYLSGNVIFTGTATPDTQTPYTVKHYYQVGNTDFYDFSGYDTLSGATETLLELSKLQKNPLENTGFTYYKARVNDNDESDDPIDIGNIDDLEEAEIQPGLVIQLFYTRNNNTLTLNTIEHAIVEKSPTGDSYYYGEAITFSGHAEEGYTFSGWSIKEGGNASQIILGSEIKYTMPSTGVVVTPVIREHSYTIHFDGNGAVGNIADKSTLYSATVTLPTAEQVAEQLTNTGHHFVGWTTGATETTVLTELSKATSDDNGEVTLYAKWDVNDGTQYLVKYYLEPVEEGKPQSEYVLQDTFTGAAPTNSVITGVLKNYDGFTTPLELTGKVAADGSLVIKYYYTRNSYTYTFNAGEGAEFEDGTDFTGLSFRYEQAVNEPGFSVVKPGFTKIGWTPELSVTMPHENKTSTVVWSENHYTIEYDANGGDGETPTQSNIAYTEPITLTGNQFVKEGYYFAGWSITKDGEVKYIDKAVVSGLTGVNNAVVKLYAHWEANGYTVTFDANSGDVSETEKNVIYDATYGELPEASRVGYTFKGWYTDKVAGVEVTSGTKVTRTEDHTLYAQWTANKYIVTFNANGGVVSQGTGEVIFDEEYGVLPTPTRIGYTFVGWYTEEPDSVKVTKNTKVTRAENHTLYAHWTANKYIVTFNANEGVVSQSTGEVTYNQSYGVLPLPTREGYSFSGWYTQAEGGEFITGTTTVTRTENHTLYAQWKANTYTVTFDANSGDVSEASRQVTFDKEYGVLPVATRTGYTFQGWYTEKDGGDNITGTTKVTIASNHTLYAHWSENLYTIEFNENGGQGPMSPMTNVKYTDEVSLTANTFTRDGYQFNGWSITSDGAKVYDDKQKVSKLTGENNATVTLYAVWQKGAYNISYNLNGGTLTGGKTNPVGYDVDTETFTLNNPERDGYDFLGWSGTEIGGLSTEVTIVKGSIGHREYEANWKAKTYTITYDLKGGELPLGKTNPEEYTIESLNFTFINPTKEGYDFLGWSGTEIDGLSTQVIIANGSTGDRKYEANWKVKTYTITWKNSTGTVLETDADVEYGTMPSYDGEEPTSGGNVQYTYTFSGWTPATGMVVGDQVYIATYISTVNEYEITFVDEDGTELQNSEVEYGKNPKYTGTTPTKAADAQYTYSFAGWTPEVHNVTGAQVYTATYTSTVNKYMITFVNEDGTELQNSEVEYGKTPEYLGATPMKSGDAQYTYTFTGWNPEIYKVTGAQVYTATYERTVNKYPVTFYDEDGVTVLKESVLYPYGTVSGDIIKPSDPTKASDGTYNYTFKGWTPEIETVVGTANYTATYESSYIDYQVIFLDSTGAVLTSGYYHSGDNVVIPAGPAKASTAQTGYTFKSWYPEVQVVTGDITYEPTYTETTRSYTIKWLSSTGLELREESLPYGSIPDYGENPTSGSTAEFDYVFKSWEPAIQAVTGDATYKATYTAHKRSYTITWNDEDGTELGITTVEYGEMPVQPTIPTKDPTEQTGYVFNGWTPSLVAVTGPKTYTATYEGTVNKYTILWKDWDGKVLKTGENIPYGTLIVNNKPSTNPSRESTAQTGYTFNDWYDGDGVQLINSKKLAGDAEYTARYDEETRSYTIIWKDRNGTELEKDENVLYGTNPVYDSNEPTSGSTAQYVYTFNGWSPGVHSVTGPEVYTAVYKNILRSYPITFYDEDGITVVKPSTMYPYGTPSTTYKPVTNPTKEGYSFEKWIPELETVVGTADYKASYKINSYKVTPVKGVGIADIIGGGTYEYNTIVTLTGYAKAGYHFEGGETVKEFNVTVPANSISVKITAEPNTYYVRYNPGDGTGVMLDQEFLYDQEKALNANTYTNEGLYFKEWTDGVGHQYNDKAKVKNLATTGVVDLFAIWTDTPEPIPPIPTPTPTPGESAAGGGRIIPTVDEVEHESADLQTGAVVQTGDDILGEDTQGETGGTITRTEEEMDAYQYAYKYHITTLAPREAAMPDDYVQRGHMAKMVVNYSINVLHRELPEKIPDYCKWNNSVDSFESQEIKEYAEKACALGIMGIDMNYFQPNKYVTRAQFGTIFGRLLWGKLPSTPYYAAHLAGLKERGIMTQIENPEDRIEIRKWAWLMFMRSEKYFNIKK